ncbi:MAG: hypothetical protein KF809_06720 [Chloroflexi bacterium]|nr:hypothetical protein [Chloroflexota bacterium]
MRISDGRPRPDYEEVLRSLGGFIDQRDMHAILLLEASDGFVVQGLAPSAPDGASPHGAPAPPGGETYTLLDDDIARFMEESRARRGTHVDGAPMTAGPYERALRVLGRYIDQQQPRNVLLFEQDRAWLIRLLMATRAGLHHMLVEFTPDEVDTMVAQAPSWRTSGPDG